MKIILTEDQYDKLLSTLTGEPNPKKSLFTKFKNWVSGNNSNEVGKMLLKSIESGNYEFEGIGTSYSTYTIKFTVNNFPFELSKINSNKYTLYLPYMGEEIKIDKKILERMFELLAQRHMDFKEYFDMYLTDMSNSL